MKNLIFSSLLIILLLLISCKNQSPPEITISEKEISIDTILLKKALMPVIQTKTIEELWDVLVFQKGGCLGGQQHITEKKRHIPTMLFSETTWEEFAKNDKEKLTQFLITKLADTTTTNVHTCPFYNTTTGEMAIYSLQHIHNKNWYDFPDFNEYKDKEITGADDQPQKWLQSTLSNNSQRKKLASLFKAQL